MAAQFLSDALKESGNTFEAIQVLEQQLADKPDPTALAGITGCEGRLVGLYSDVGRDADAQQWNSRYVSSCRQLMRMIRCWLVCGCRRASPRFIRFRHPDLRGN